MPSFCPACNASNPAANHQCNACGAVLGAAAVASGRRPRFRHQVASGHRALNSVRFTFLVVGTLALLWSGFVALALAALDADLEPEGRGVLLINLALGVAVVVTAALGVWRAQRNPLPWAIGAAGLLTLALVLPLLQGRPPGALQILITLSAWGGVVPILRLGRLAQENPDLEELRDLDKPLDPRQQARARAKLRGVGRDFRTAGIVFAVFLVGLVSLIFGGGTLVRVLETAQEARGEERPSQPIDAVLLRFEQAWARSDAKAIEPLFAPRLQHKAARIGPTLERKGFKSPYPALRDRRSGGETGTRQTVTYTTDVCDVKVVFEWANNAWGIGNFIFS